MFEICLLDLDDTLVRTSDLKEVREAGVGNNSKEYLAKLKAAAGDVPERRIYQPSVLESLRSEFKEMKVGVFTRAPRSYANFMLEAAFPNFHWDIVIAFEDVRPTKPYGAGIDLAMQKFGITKLGRVMLVGDNDADVRSAYNCGCLVTLDKGAWPYKREREHWNALERMPDAIIDEPEDLLEVLRNPAGFWPELERQLNGANRNSSPRFDEIGHWIPKTVEEDKTRYVISMCGRSFANYNSIKWRKKWHQLTASIEDNKDADTFPDEWVQTVRTFIEAKYMAYFSEITVHVTVIPHRPGRKPRLENFLSQLQASVNAKPIHRRKVLTQPELLAYKKGVKSQHNDHLGREERFVNVRDHLFVNRPGDIKAGEAILVIDDVTTTGASLIYASKYLKAAGASSVKCLSMAKNVGELYYSK